ncbi:unnamed protein product [Ostreobium quekettii]|uniref:Uncharacterized protein n=1 Tax=Ostreobium quekettii TaxID=121088 RepID=A0A8S1IP68_9CHLO|nr:unnamed protein product [Ostreobium quekettii]
MAGRGARTGIHEGQTKSQVPQLNDLAKKVQLDRKDVLQWMKDFSQKPERCDIVTCRIWPSHAWLRICIVLAMMKHFVQWAPPNHFVGNIVSRAEDVAGLYLVWHE